MSQTWVLTHKEIRSPAQVTRLLRDQRLKPSALHPRQLFLLPWVTPWLTQSARRGPWSILAVRLGPTSQPWHTESSPQICPGTFLALPCSPPPPRSLRRVRTRSRWSDVSYPPPHVKPPAALLAPFAAPEKSLLHLLMGVPPPHASDLGITFLGFSVRSTFYSFFFKNFYWSRVDLQCCVSLRYTAKWICYTYT